MVYLHNTCFNHCHDLSRVLMIFQPPTSQGFKMQWGKYRGGLINQRVYIIVAPTVRPGVGHHRGPPLGFTWSARLVGKLVNRAV